VAVMDDAEETVRRCKNILRKHGNTPS
jgi:hypothetical protein